jgi:hypothetical protein
MRECVTFVIQFDSLHLIIISVSEEPISMNNLSGNLANSTLVVVEGSPSWSPDLGLSRFKKLCPSEIPNVSACIPDYTPPVTIQAIPSG